jgi:hypothetical protein
VKIAIPEIGYFDENDALTVVRAYVLLEPFGKGRGLMAHLNLRPIWLLIGANAALLRTIPTVISFAVCLCAYCAVSHAAPITLRFEAVVGPPRQGTFPIQLPFSFAEGDRISGRFTFEPLDVPSEISQTSSNQGFPIRFEIDQVVLQSAHYEIHVEDNLVSDDGPIPRDQILLQCLGSGTPCVPEPIEQASHVQWSFSWTFSGHGGVLHGADIPGNVETWNQFLPNTILLSFQDRTTGRGTGFQAEVGNVAIVPEPSTIRLTAIFWTAVIGMFVAVGRERYS